MRLMQIVSGLSLSLALTAATANAAPISFWSGDGNDVIDHGTVTAITPHPAWGDVNGLAGTTQAKWISYMNSGWNTTTNAPQEPIAGPNVPQGQRIPANATLTITRTFDISGLGLFDFFVLADDTATVQFGKQGQAPTTYYDAVQGQVDPCASGFPGSPGFLGPISCVNGAEGHVSLNSLSAGLYTLTIYLYQTNNMVFGTQFAGSYTQADPPPSVPEPTSMVLLGTGLIGFAGRAIRRRRAAIS